jgi:integrase
MVIGFFLQRPIQRADSSGMSSAPGETATVMAKKGAVKRARRKRGEGSIFFHAVLGLWSAIASLGTDERGKRKRRQVYGHTQGAVLAKLKAIEYEVRSGGSPEKPTRKTLATFLTEWLDESVAPTLRPPTLRSYTGAVSHIAGPHGIGNVKLRDLNPQVITKFYARLRRDEVGARTQLLVHAVLRRALNYAVRQELIIRNPALGVDAPTYTAKRIQPLTGPQIRQFLAAAKGDRLEALYVLAVLSGARQGELFALDWGDVDFDSATIRIRQSLQDVSGAVSIGATKSEASRRQVYLPKVAVEALRRHRRRAMANGLSVAAGEAVFRAPDGGPLRRSNVLLRSFKPLLVRAKLPNIRFHDLRHSYATALLTSGADAKVIQAQLGHSEIRLTLDTYAHVLPSVAKGAVGKLDDAFGPKRRRKAQSTP